MGETDAPVVEAKPRIEPWKPAQIMKLKSLWILAQARRDAHEIAFRYFNKFHTAVSLPTILVGAILSTLSFNPEEAPPALNETCAIFMTVTSITNAFFQFSKKAEGHRQTYRGFNLLLREMEMCILRGQDQPKRDFVEFLEYISDRVSDLVSDAPVLNKSAYNILMNKKLGKPSPFDQLGTSEEDTRVQIETPGASVLDNGENV